jgi:hypothetical protein
LLRRLKEAVHRADREIISYFAYARAGVKFEGEGLTDVPFGEFLVERKALSRVQLLRALQEQDRHPGVRLGEVIAYLGFLPYRQIDRMLTEYHALPVVEI